MNRTLRFKNDVFEGLKQQTTIDSLLARNKKSELELRIVRHNLYKVYKQNRVANIFTAVGYGLTLLSPLILNDQPELAIISGISGGILITGSIIFKFDSNKFLGLAGKKYKVVKVQRQL